MSDGWGRKFKANCKWCNHQCQTEIYSESASCDDSAACRDRMKRQIEELRRRTPAVWVGDGPIGEGEW